MLKIHVILTLFVLLVMVYFVFILQRLIKDYNKKEKFDEKQEDKKDDKKSEDKKEEKISAKKETYADKQLDKNLFIINTFEEVHDRKIKTDELKKFAEMFSSNDISKKEMKDTIENYDNEKFSAKNNNMDELLEVSKKLTAVIEKMKKDEDNKSNDPVVEKFSGFDDIMPFSNEKKYVMLR